MNKYKKWFTTIKIGYTAGIYGCSGEYFTTILSNGQSLHFYGLYGTEERVARALRDKGYQDIYTPSFYGRMTRKDITKMHISEREVLSVIETIK